MQRHIRYAFFLLLACGSLQADYADYLVDSFKNPSKVIELKGGLSRAKNYKITFGKEEYVLRVLDPDASIETREHEVAAASYAGTHQIGPDVHYIDPEYRAMIMDFVRGETLNAYLLQDKKVLKMIVRTMRAMHESKGDFPQGLTVFERIKTQLTNLLSSQIPCPKKAIQDALKKLNRIEKEFQRHSLVPCHNDLSALNIIVDGTECKFIDWTDSGLGYAYNDLGYFLLVNPIKTTRYKEILGLYLSRKPTRKEYEQLLLMKDLSALRIFASNFPAYEPSISDTTLREQYSLSYDEMLSGEDLLPIEHYFDLHAKGLLEDRTTIVNFSLSCLKTFLNKRGLYDVSKNF